MSALGTCNTCHGDLCVTQDEVACEECGLPVPNHPLVVERRKNPVTPSAAIKPAPNELAVTWLDRIMRLESQVDQLMAAIKAAQERLAHLEARKK